MLPRGVEHLPSASRERFQLAYDNAKKRPIGWWETDDIAVGIVQAWLRALGGDLPKSTSVDADGNIEADGIFGEETFKAVQAFQRKKKIKPDGMVGHDTLDALNEALRTEIRRPSQPTSTVFVKKPGEFPRRCQMSICPDI
jgi:murein L,D-transpeptidase YcbB/YkuD